MVYTVTNNTYPASVAGHGMLVYYIPYQYGTLYGPERWWNENDLEEAYLLMAKYWSASVWIGVLYAIGIHVLQRYMADKPPYEMKGPLIYWNAFLAVFSLVGLVRMSEEFWYVLSTRPVLDSISYTLDPFQPAAFWATMFAASKVVELGDTVFVVLRKKPLIFLHWYHHATVLMYVWHAAKEGVAACRCFVWMNYFVHTLMYTYYALAAAGIRLPRRCSMTLTTMQTTQMFIGVAITFIVFYYKLQGRIMQQSYENLSFCFTIYVSFAYLFSDFFSSSYLTEKQKKAKAE